MNTPNKDLMRNARVALTGKWRLAIKVVVVYFLIAILLGAIPGIGFLAQLAINGPLMVGFSLFWLNLARNTNPEFNQLFSGFDHWSRALKAYLLMLLYVLLWSILFIVPGIIAGLAYSQTFFILAEDKTIGSRAALRKSKALMDGNKWKLFCLGLRFIGWFLLCILTLGIGFIWLTPYIHTAMAKFYDDIKIKEPLPAPVLESVPTPESSTVA